MSVILEKLINNEIERLFIDTRLYKSNSYHIGFEDIKKQIPKEFRHKVVCIHLKDDFDENEIKKEGFCLLLYIKILILLYLTNLYYKLYYKYQLCPLKLKTHNLNQEVYMR